jgi:hypothetical protein
MYLNVIKNDLTDCEKDTYSKDSTLGSGASVSGRLFDSTVLVCTVEKEEESPPFTS